MSPKPKTNMDPVQARRRLDEKRDQILALAGDDENEHWKTGSLYAQIVDEQLAEAAGYRKPQDFVAVELKGTVPASSLRRYAAVARVFPEAVAARYGMIKLSTLLTIHHLAPFEPLPLDPSELPIPTDGAEPKAFKECSKAELTGYVKLLKGAAEGELREEDVAEVERRQRIVDATLGEECEAQVRAHRKGDEVTLDLLGVPMERLNEVLKALTT